MQSSCKYFLAVLLLISFSLLSLATPAGAKAVERGDFQHQAEAASDKTDKLDKKAKEGDVKAKTKAKKDAEKKQKVKEKLDTAPEEQDKRDIRARIQAILHPEVIEEIVPDEYTIVPYHYSTAILGKAMATKEQCVRHLLKYSPNPLISVSAEELVDYYYQEATKEGIRPDVAFAQALKETGYFRYGGTVVPEQNNYCGLGTTSDKVKGAYFPTAQIGVRAHIQHIVAYASDDMPKEPLVDPRFTLARQKWNFVIFDEWTDFNGRWAVPGNGYGESILNIHKAICNS